MDHDFEDVEVKRDALFILEDQLRRRRKPCMIGTGAMSDPYIPLENELRITRGCLELIEKYGFGATIITKSAGILRDIDILKAINENTKCVVQITMTTFDEGLCRKIEPNVSTTKERFHVLEKMKEAGIPTVVWLCPTLPFINDTEENLLGLLDYCIRAGVRGILFFGFGMTLREGNREYFYSKLDELFPGMKEIYIRTYGNAYSCNSPRSKKLAVIFRDICKERGIAFRPDQVFAYLKEFETRERQLSLFE
jgi:DNA repair photolyase